MDNSSNSPSNMDNSSSNSPSNSSSNVSNSDNNRLPSHKVNAIPVMDKQFDILDNYTESDMSESDAANNKIVLSDLVKQISRRAMNTTSSVYKVRDPDIQQLLFCIGAVIQSQIIADLDKTQDETNLIFDRSDYTVEQIPPNILALEASDNQELMDQMIKGDVPSINGMYEFLMKLKKGSILFSTECHIIALIYINRITNIASIKITSRNWQNLWVSSFILAQKVWYDKHMKTSSFAGLMPSADKKTLRRMEVKVLGILDFSVCIRSCLYAKYYFDLRHLHFVGCSDKDKEWSIKPLSICQALRLELSSKNPNTSTTKKVRRSGRLVIDADKMPSLETKSSNTSNKSPDGSKKLSNAANAALTELPSISNNQNDNDDDFIVSPSRNQFAMFRANSMSSSSKEKKLNQPLRNKTYEDVTILQDRSRFVIPL